MIVWIVGLGFFALFLARTGVHESVPLLARLTPLAVVVVLALNATVPLLKMIRWHMLLGSCGVHVRRRDLLVPVSAGFFWGLVTPGTSGEMGRGFLLGIPRRVGVSTVLYEKVYDAIALLSLALAAVFARLVLDRGSSHAVAYAVAIATVLVLHAAPLVLARLVHADEAAANGARLRDRAVRVLAATRGLARAPRVAVWSAIVSLLLWGITGAQFIILIRVLGAPTFPWSGVGLGFFVPYIAGIVSLVPLGLGVLELTVSALLARYYAVSPATAHATALAFRLLVTLPFVLWGFACYSWQATAARRRARMTANAPLP